MKIIERLIACILIISFINSIGLIKYKYPAFFLNFQGENGEGFRLNSKWHSNSSEEVKKYKERIIRDMKMMIPIEVICTLLFIIM